MLQSGTDESTGTSKDLRATLEFRSRVDALRGRLLQMARDVEKPLGEVGDLRSAAAHLRHVALVARSAAFLDEIALFVDYQGARRILHIPVAARVRAHLRDIAGLAGGDEDLALALARTYLGFAAQVARVAQSQRPSRVQTARREEKERARAGAPGGKPSRESRPEGRATPGDRPAADATPGSPTREGRGRRRRGGRPDGRAPRPEGAASRTEGATSSPRPDVETARPDPDAHASPPEAATPAAPASQAAPEATQPVPTPEGSAQ